MAVTMTQTDFQTELRLANSQEERKLAARLLGYVSVAVLRYAPDCPDEVHNEAAVRLGAYLYNQPEATRGDAYANAMRSSGAARAMLPWKAHGAGIPDAA